MNIPIGETLLDAVQASDGVSAERLLALIAPETPARLAGQDGSDYGMVEVAPKAPDLGDHRLTPAQMIDTARRFAEGGGRAEELSGAFLAGLVELLLLLPLDDLIALRAEYAAAPTTQPDAERTPPQELAA
ncbi:MAG: hypothetical protein C0499_02625 [Zymomonas sp.]|nr:hypothetical protein [Zymomonas sp.]